MFNFKYFLIFIFSIFIPFNLFALDKNLIEINGNENIDDEVIFSIIDDLPITEQNDFRLIIKKLYETGSFKNVEIISEDNKIFINLIEQPKINNIEFIGNERFKETEILDLFNKNNSLQYFNEKEIDKFINELKNLYLSFGYNQIAINYDFKDDALSNNDFIDLIIHISEGKISKIHKVVFIGNNSFSHNTLLSQIKSTPKNTLIFFTNRNYKSYEAKNDVIRLTKFYNEMGYKNSSVELKTEYIQSKNKFNLFFYINEGQEFLFDNFDLNFEYISLTEIQQFDLINILESYLTKFIENKPKYNPYHLNKIETLLTDYLFEGGLSFFNIQTLEKSENANVDIMFKILSNKPKYVNNIFINGNTRTYDKVIRREMEIAEGDPINDHLLDKSRRNLSKLNLFKDIIIEEKNIDDENVNIYINVEEKPTGDFQIGLSLGTLEGATFVTGLKERNIAGLGREVEFTANTSSDNTIYSFNVTEPYIFNKKVNFLYGVNYSEKDFSSSSSYNLSSLSSNVGFLYHLADNIFHKIILNYELKDYEITDTSLVSSNIASSAGANAEISLQNTFSYDKLNSFIRPTYGQYTSFTNIISPITDSDNGFIKNIFVYKKYSNFNKNIFSIQSKVGNIVSLQDEEITTDNKFSLGGRWLRGFDSYGAGPRNSRTSYVGGNNLFVTKLDYKRSFSQLSDNPIDFNLFTDFGTLFGNKNDPTYFSESLRASYGFGINFYSPLGPIGLSWGFPLLDESYDKKRMFLFSIGNLN